MEGVIPFPVPERRRSILFGGSTAPRLNPLLCPPAAPNVESQSFSQEQVASLWDTVFSTVTEAERLIVWLDRERKRARSAGVETILVELSALVEGERFRSAYDAIRGAFVSKEELSLSLSGLDKIKRAEALLSEIRLGLGRSGIVPPETGGVFLFQGARTLGQSGSSSFGLVLPWLGFGIVSIGAGVLLYLLLRNR